MSTALRLSACLLVAAALAACNDSGTATPDAADAPVAARDASADSASASREDTPGEAAGAWSVPLTMDKIRAYTQALKNLQGVAQVDPATGDSETDQLAEESSEQFAARLGGNARLRAAIEGAGLSTLEFVRIGATLFSALMAQGMLDAGQIKTLPEGTDPANVEFVRRHQDEIKALMAPGNG